jgi:uncharacterized membrane protein YGL010W
VAEVLGRFLYYPIVAVLLGVLLMRRRASDRKRLAVLLWACALLALRVSSWLFVRLSIPDGLLIVPVVALAAACWALRSRLAPFRLRCASCRARLALREVLASDDALCSRCRDAGQQAAEPEGRW